MAERTTPAAKLAARERVQLALDIVSLGPDSTNPELNLNAQKILLDYLLENHYE